DRDAAAREAGIRVEAQRRGQRAEGRASVERPRALDPVVEGALAPLEEQAEQRLLQAGGTAAVFPSPARACTGPALDRVGAEPGGLGEARPLLQPAAERTGGPGFAPRHASRPPPARRPASPTSPRRRVRSFAGGRECSRRAQRTPAWGGSGRPTRTS